MKVEIDNFIVLRRNKKIVINYTPFVLTESPTSSVGPTF